VLAAPACSLFNCRRGLNDPLQTRDDIECSYPVVAQPGYADWRQ
jgi:hypothetical protein